jgi:hypothetical protein
MRQAFRFFIKNVEEKKNPVKTKKNREHGD